MNVYEDDTKLGELSEKLVSIGHDIFQVFWLHNNKEDHIKKLLEFFDFPENVSVIDLGCGVGGVARLMKRMRPDLNFVLVNKSRAQLSMCPDEFQKIESDMCEIDFPAQYIMINYALGHVPLDKAISKFSNLLKSSGGGYLYIYDIGSTNKKRIDELNYDLHSPREISSIAKKSGFSLINIIENPKTYYHHFIDIVDEDTFSSLFIDTYPYMAKLAINEK